MNKPLAAIATVVSIATILLAAQHQRFSWVDAGGPKLRMLIEGSGSPTVVFEAGGEGSLELWGGVPSAVSQLTKTISYDRAGNGLSDKSITPRDARHIAAELHTALQNANALPPYVLVGHSVGGPYVRVFAGMYPNEIAGLVLVDPTQEETMAWNAARWDAAARDQCTVADERSCETAILTQASESRVPPNIPVFLIHVIYNWGPAPFASRVRDEIQRIQMPSVPVRLKFHQQWVDAIPGAKLISTEKSSHGLINFEEPELVIRTIREAVEKARAR